MFTVTFSSSLGSGETFYRRRGIVNRRTAASATDPNSAVALGAGDHRLSSPSLSTVLPSACGGGYQNGGLLSPGLLYREDRSRLVSAAPGGTTATSCSLIRPEEDHNG